MRRLGRRFYARDTFVVAQELLGHTLYVESEEGLAGGRIVEVEAYCGTRDPGSHAYRGQTSRNTVMFGPAGHLYVYFTYGMHHCANIVTETDGVAGAVLLRAIEPTWGSDLMAERRGTDAPRLLASGPGRLCRALGLDRSFNGADLVTGPVWVEARRRVDGPVSTSGRIGLRGGSELPWRFFEIGPWTSRPSGRGGPTRRGAASPR
ncbi:MAG: DNA-3-methyladenine glycosylase [Actinomycetota bacterium]